MGKLSVIMPSLNVVNYIEECLDSVLAQKDIDLEIICVDAGSTDGTLEILQCYEKNNQCVRVIRSEKKSYGYQMNLGIQASQGDYIGIVETDDYIVPETFCNLYKMAKKHYVDFVKSGYTSFFEYGGKRIYSKIQNTAIREIQGEVLDLNEKPKYRLIDVNHIWSGIYRKSFLLDNDLWFNETPGASFQDTSFSILVGLVAKKCIYTQDCYYHYRTDREESSVKSEKKYKCVVDEFIYIDRYLRIHNMNTKENQNLVMDVKLKIYEWNILRLTEKSRELFSNEIYEQMTKVISEPNEYSRLSEEQKKTIHMLLNPTEIKEIEESQKKDRKKTLDIIKRGINGEKFVFVGIGNYFKTFLTYQKTINTYFISEVCDNNKEVHGMKIFDYTIMSVENAVEKNGKTNWIVANKYYSDQIEKQLLTLNIPEEKIICIRYLPRLDEIINEIF